MYIPSAFAEQRLDVLHDFMTAHPFATLITHGDSGIIASHVPVVLHRARGDHGTLRFHLAKPNLQCDDLAAGSEALVVFHGPHAYISPTWYATKASVPTWNYAAVHAYGTPRTVDDEALCRHLDELVTRYENEWTADAAFDAEALTRLRLAIVGFEIPITRLEGKWKLGQNRTTEDRSGAIAGLRSTGREGDATIANWMGDAMRR